MNPFGLGVRAYAGYNVLRGIRRLRVAGASNIPRRGPALLAARHYHHLYDGAALLWGLARQPHLLVALDWTQNEPARIAMETLCNLCEWPIVMRTERIANDSTAAFARAQARHYLRVASTRVRDLLSRGEIVAIFPEGYPTIDPAGSPKSDDATILPFRSGVIRFALDAARASGGDVPIVPIGLAYTSLARGRYDLTLRAGAPLTVSANSRTGLAGELERRVRQLSAP